MVLSLTFQTVVCLQHVVHRAFEVSELKSESSVSPRFEIKLVCVYQDTIDCHHFPQCRTRRWEQPPCSLCSYCRLDVSLGCPETVQLAADAGVLLRYHYLTLGKLHVTETKVSSTCADGRAWGHSTNLFYDRLRVLWRPVRHQMRSPS